MKYVSEEGEVTAHQWFKLEDFPGQKKVVPYQELPDLLDSICLLCGKTLKEHGQLKESGIVVCPGDYIIEKDDGFVVSHPTTFENVFQEVRG